MSARWLTGAVALATFALAGCSSDYHVDFSYLTDPPETTSITSDSIALAAGDAVGVEATLVENGDRVGIPFELEPVHPGILGIAPAPEEREWVVWGIAEGSTEVDVFVDGEHVGVIPATVTAWPDDQAEDEL